MVELVKRQLPQCFGCNQCDYRTGTFRAICPQCGSEGMIAHESAEGGRILDFVPIAYPPENLKHLGSYVSVLVKLDDGCRLFGIVLENPDHVKIGTPVMVSSFNPQTKEVLFKTAAVK